MAYADIHAALTQSVIDLLPSIPISHENSPFNPDVEGGDLFVAVYTLLNNQESLTKTTLDEVRGVYQISVYSKSNVGKGATLSVTDAITNYYKHNLSLTSGAQTVTIVNSGVGAPRNDSGWYITDISIIFKSDILR